MRTHHLTRIGAPALLLGLVAVGCTPNMRPAALSSSVPLKPEKQAARRAGDALAAIKTRDADKAVAAAEEAVALAPRNAEYRATLGQAYLIAGRFTSAEASFADAVALDPTPGKPGFNLALSQIALGKWDVARASLARLEGVVPDTDIGLARALAGDREGAIVILERAARTQGAGVKARQNLALAYALAGRWAEAQNVAAQDLPGNQLLIRIGEWSQFARPQASWDQVASLLGVTPVDDPGRPVALALGAGDDAAPMLAEAPSPQPDPAEAATMIAQADDSVSPTTAPEPDAGPLASIPPAAVHVAAVSATPASARIAVAGHGRAHIASPAPLRSGGRWVIQLGAFSQPAALKAAWSRVSGRVAALRGYVPAGSTFSVGGSGTVHRLTMSGFATRGDAQRLCARIKGRGGACFVRPAAGEQPLQWASRANNLLAMR
ncbi:MAG: sporulation protein [Sphingomonas bacterium]|nr:SPOR domain-containing protein [Sphingomonas bacterium]MDB5690017.1 sporulation protein [Sphingomonas bacterium]